MMATGKPKKTNSTGVEVCGGIKPIKPLPKNAVKKSTPKKKK